jgi:hypothetical protein
VIEWVQNSKQCLTAWQNDKSLRQQLILKYPMNNGLQSSLSFLTCESSEVFLALNMPSPPLGPRICERLMHPPGNLIFLNQSLEERA